ncbi:competence protein ComK [uncultured Faecalibaculum sp.]|uniref:competence protein ComK n=1 Tax=uncultured Faecalibaculum sp. TaxID=1729681 RepID=UPI00262CE658|nr:competence protein ComK [uncultured Faecalibaculum sp.]
MAVIESVRYCSRQVVINDTSCQPAASIEAWIGDLCILRGSTLEGRRMAFRQLTGQKQKIPVYVDDDTILVPLQAAGDLDCCWLNWVLQPDRIPDKTSRNIRTFLRIIHSPKPLWTS